MLHRHSARLLVAAVTVLAVAAFAACSAATPDPDSTPDAGTKAPDAGTKPDAGTPHDAGTDVDAGTEPAVIPCGDVTPQGACSGEHAQWCDDSSNELQSVDCTAISEDAAGNPVGGTCVVLDGFGSWCAVAPAKTCAVQYDDGSFDYFVCGTSTGPAEGEGCDVEAGCVTTAKPCTYAGDAASFAPVCNGTKLQLDCMPWNQPIEVDCTGAYAGGTGCADGACTGIPKDGACDGDLYQCADGLDCDDTTGTCQ
jgi:hypothetical protein